jgi:hypothetical protein
MAELVGISYAEFCERFDWLNLYGENPVNPRDVRMEDARRQAHQLNGSLGRYERVVLLGELVADAFGFGQVPKYEWRPLEQHGRVFVARMPHTSETNWRTRGAHYWAPARAFAETLKAFGATEEISSRA